MTKPDIVFYIYNTLHGGQSSDDDRPSLEQIGHAVDFIRATLIKEMVNQRRPVSETWKQDLGCVPLRVLDESECCAECPDLDSGNNVLRTVDPIPAPIRSNYGLLLDYVGSTDRKTGLQLIGASRERWRKYDKYSSNIKCAYYRNGYIYLTTRESDDFMQDYLSVIGVFEEPEKVKYYNKCGDAKPCYDVEIDQYPVSMDLERTIIKMFLDENAKLLLVTKEDTKNDASNTE